ncbi:hypothetical protein CYMTET_26743 [Cymbomonas tetramitiformis]|uniref:Uncharacterized protein n=1 Tax=Cymbomonas tetramitiformis TaxID=36881 RepID=A0AAE0KXM5_9CHLO|nr:hypothetical protein CYMTET_26743 [Cymbomonas tetramitiformis]|eukprot:gene4067-5041_t
MSFSYSYPEYECLLLKQLAPHILECRLNRAAKRNSFSPQMWKDIKDFFNECQYDTDTRTIILSGAGKMFTCGLDLVESMGVLTSDDDDMAHRALRIRDLGKSWQESLTNVEKCGKVVIACIHHACIGVGLELASACDIRLCSADAWFAMKEVDIGLAADVGGLQRFPKIVGNQSIVRELAFTARDLHAEEAYRLGFVSKVCHNQEGMMDHALKLGQMISSKSPVATLGVKQFLNYTRDHTVDEALEYAITWNQSMLLTMDMPRAISSMLEKKQAEFPSLPPKTKAKL